MPLRIGIDIGGAFTDLVSYDDKTGEMRWVKVETTPADPSIGVLNSVKKSGISMKNANVIVHGQTLVINTIITRSGAKVGLITTKGFRDNLEIQRSNRRDMYNFRYKKPEPFVPRYLRLEVDERVMADGSVLRELNEDQVKQAVKRLLSEGVESICISFINSYANPKHEIRAGEIVKEIAKEVPITLSHEITREWREYERTSTAVLNSYVMPKMQKYLGKLRDSISSMGFSGIYFAMLSSGGMATFDYAERYPIYTIESGPVAGVIGAMAVGEAIGEKNIIALDGGSTTTKASLVENMSPKISAEYHVERDRFRSGYPVIVPVLETVEVGNGGTSEAWIDSVGNLKVGPKAVGADPGPACYGRGGNIPTVTDAYVVNGLLNPKYLLGGELPIHRDLGEKVIREKIAKHFNVSVEQASEGIIKLANDNAALAIRLVSVQKGYDPRDFTLIAYGGSGPMFAPFIAEELEIRKIVVPVIPPGVFSAWGMLLADIKHDVRYTFIVRLDSQDATSKVNSIYEELEKKVREVFASEGFDPKEVVIERYADMRYYGQEHTVRVPIMGGKIGGSEIEEIKERFHSNHYREYSFRLDSSPVEIVNFHVTGIIPVKRIKLAEIPERNNSLEKAVKEERDVFLNGGHLKLKIYDRDMLPRDKTIKGPSIIEGTTSTAIILEGQEGHVDKYGNLVIFAR
ncbi:hydantoinase/oxoprolinase family protein [Candidatus Korarchaeum cryptofilum]|uniref:Hydantoinase/oxoprolinase family protein n=1 Tax=Candidatus Korarchaeum cryptofilum TaxID=498846 RepID=A0A3R9P9K3_9CREN|nr:hydantoinase/oxoprolinase family protein [Candidatus Korarchaeum cryptofilum]RSN68022.1 hydantoinase/oxoprolinase family protein [Candidatus Korarchaeum cryptofilum]